MGYDLQRWALTEQHPCLTPRTRLVLAAICMVAHDDHGEFWMRGKRLIEEHIPDMSYSSYKNHLSTLLRNELLTKLEHGGGRTSGGRGKSSRYRVNAPSVTPQQPPQGVLPEIVHSPDARPPDPETTKQPQVVDASAVHRKIDEILATGVTPAQLLSILDFTASTLTDAPATHRETGQMQTETGQVQRETGNENGPVSQKQVTESDQFPTNPTGFITCFDEETGQVHEKQVTKTDQFLRNRSDFMTSLHYTEEKIGEEKEKAAAAANWSGPEREPSEALGNPSASPPNTPDFFQILADKLADIGHRGIKPAQFEHLRQLLPQYAAVTGGILPDDATADYIVGRLTASSGIRNVAGFVLAITEDVLRTGEGYEEPQPTRTPPPSQPEPDSAPDPPNWELLHLAHIEQTAPARNIWTAALEKVRPEVARPAFETWLSDTTGWAYAERTFVVCTHNTFKSEMLANRLHPIIERAVRDITGEVLTIKYTVKAQDNETCSACQHAKEVTAAAS